MVGKLGWLPSLQDFSALLAKATGEADWSKIVALSKADLDIGQILALDRGVQKLKAKSPLQSVLTPLKLALLSSSTVEHLLPAMRVAGLRHGYLLEVYFSEFGQYLKDIHDKTSRLYAFAPNVIVFSFDAPHLFGQDVVNDPDTALATLLERLSSLWRTAREAFGAQVIQQTALSSLLYLMGENEHRLPGSPQRMAWMFNQRLRDTVDSGQVDLLSLDHQIAIDGLGAWHDPALWLRAKQDISPTAAHYYADLVLRLVNARRGRSAKCLVLDLDNTLWGGVIGDDGLEGIILGQGNAVGEAYIVFQTYVRNLTSRGIILAVCSKNDEANALAPFEKHPEMVLKREHISCFVANWEDKASNLRRIAKELNIGLDALVFADDNLFERNIVRRELPMVRVPELPEDPALFARCLAESGYLECVAVTDEDRVRTRFYQENKTREAMRAEATDLAGYLSSLNMVMEWKLFDAIGQQRITQLVNKTNQFNLTTKRYTDAEITSLMQDPRHIGLQIRLRDDLGDHGIIAILIGNLLEDGSLEIETWLMSCRVLGRNVEQACFNVMAEEASKIGAEALIGRYIPTEKNGMVRDHYNNLGFQSIAESENGTSVWRFDLKDFTEIPVPINVVKVEQ